MGTLNLGQVAPSRSRRACLDPSGHPASDSDRQHDRPPSQIEGRARQSASRRVLSHGPLNSVPASLVVKRGGGFINSMHLVDRGCSVLAVSIVRASKPTNCSHLHAHRIDQSCSARLHRQAPHGCRRTRSEVSRFQRSELRCKRFLSIEIFQNAGPFIGIPFPPGIGIPGPFMGIPMPLPGVMVPFGMPRPVIERIGITRSAIG